MIYNGPNLWSISVESMRILKLPDSMDVEKMEKEYQEKEEFEYNNIIAKYAENNETGE